MEHIFTVVATVGKPHGLTGEVTVLSRTDEPARRFAAGQRVTIEGTGRVLTLRGYRMHNGTLLLGFAEVTDRAAAEALRGQTLVASVPADERPTEADEYFDRQLVGLTAVSPAGERLGRVTGVQHLPAQDLLAIETPAGERLVPFVSELVTAVDLAAGTCTVTPIPGLLDEEDAS